MTDGSELETIETYMREHGFRWTNQRRVIAKVAMATHKHFDAEELLEMCRVEDDGISRATVYRTLAMLEEAGFVESLDTGVGGKKYEHVLGHEHHDHMICTACGKIIEFVDDELEKRQEIAAKQHDFVIRDHDLKLFGTCAEYARSKTCPELKKRRQEGSSS